MYIASIALEAQWGTKMNKAERKQVDRAIALLHSDARLSAATLATIHRSGNTKTQREVASVIESHPGIKSLLTVVNGCYVERGTR